MLASYVSFTFSVAKHYMSSRGEFQNYAPCKCNPLKTKLHLVSQM